MNILPIKFLIMALGVSLSAYGVYGAYQQELTIYTGGRNLDQALLHANGLTAVFLGLALMFLGKAIFCFIGASISRHPVRLERWEVAAKVLLALFFTCTVVAALYFITSAV